MSDLEAGLYKNRAEVVHLFCRHVIPYIRDNPDLMILVKQWREEYEQLSREFNDLQEIVFQKSWDAFKKIILEDFEVSELVSFKVKEIKDILAGDRSQRGFTTFPLYWELYKEIESLLDLLLKQGRSDLCSRYALIVTDSRNELCIKKLNFALEIDKIPQIEEMLNYSRYQDPNIVWKYFEIACYFWNIKDEDIEKELNLLHKKNPFYAMGAREKWEEIAKLKKQDRNSKQPLIFKTDFFKTGLRTLINEITTFSQTQEEKQPSILHYVATTVFISGIIWVIMG